MDNERLNAQMRFLLEIDKLKRIVRRTLLTDASRHENSAEHSWHVALMALTLEEYAAEPMDVIKAVRMLLVHDLVEIDAGDTFCYDEQGNQSKPAREQAAAERIFGLLPPDQAREARALWDEFEARQSPEARYAAAMDRLQPLLHNYATKGAAWRRHGITLGQVLARNKHMAEGAPALWAYAQAFLQDAAAKGYLPEDSCDAPPSAD